MNIRPFPKNCLVSTPIGGTAAMQSKTDAFGKILEQVKQPITANFLQLLSAAAEYLETGEAIAEILL